MIGVRVGLSISPLAKRRLNEAFRFSICLWRVGPGADVFEAESPTGVADVRPDNDAAERPDNDPAENQAAERAEHEVERSCSTANLTPGKVVREAELKITRSGHVWKKIELGL